MSAWQNDAACATHPEPDLWHYDDVMGMTAAKAAAINAAKAVCATCPVVAQCLQDALDNGYTGVWGGTTHNQRRKLRRRSRRPTVAKCGTYSGYSRHRDLGEPACEECKAAKAAFSRKRYHAADERRKASA